MRKIVLLIILGLYIVSCAPQGSLNQTWHPRQHKRQNFVAAPKKAKPVRHQP
jgi:hypothetical protein